MVDYSKTRSAAIIRLSERQSECLRLLARGQSAKEIAAELGLSVETVNSHLKAARRTLGVGSSRQAARMLMDEGNWSPEGVGTQLFGIAEQVSSTLTEAEQGDGEREESRQAGNMVSDSWTATASHLDHDRTSPPSLRGRLDDMTPLQRSVLMGLALTAAVIVIAGLVAIATSLQSLLWSIYYGR